jgi:hypothetical protein
MLDFGKEGGMLTKIEDELDDLHNGDVLLPPDADSTRALEVVPVHDDVDGQVERNRNPGHGRVTQELSVAEESGGTMVVSVQESCNYVSSGLQVFVQSAIRTQRLLLEEEEDGIDEFKVLGQVVELRHRYQQSVSALEISPVKLT